MMNNQPALERCRTFIDCQSRDPTKRASLSGRSDPRPTITISRATGAGGIPVAEKLAEYLQAHVPRTGCAWTIFDKNLVEKVLDDHNLPKRLAQFLPEDKVSGIADMMEELLGLHPPAWTLIRQTTETILRLARLGNVILVGRGATVITGKLENAFHVRLVGSLEPRIKLVQEYYHLNHEAAVGFVHEQDRGRKRYVQNYFHQNIDDPTLYHLIINTDRFSFDEVARLIGGAVVDKFYQHATAAAK
ncbi:MAG: cytidylate kinase-like family protein [Limisphaerales bacterium]